MSRPSLPLVVLAGSDKRPGRLPAGAENRPLVGVKAVDLDVGGRPLVAVVLERARGTGAFDPIYVAGPASRYRALSPAPRLIDVDGTFGENIRAATERVLADGAGTRVAMMTCDILPTEEDLAVLTADLARHPMATFWFPVIEAPEDPATLGASQWKPRYRMAPTRGAEPREVLPGHLVVVDTAAFRLDLLYTAFDVAYRTRNRSALYRFSEMAAEVLFHLLGEDLRRLARGRLPVLTCRSLWHGFVVAWKVWRHRAAADEIAAHLDRTFGTPEFRRHHPESGGRLPFFDALSMAMDIDTVEEAREITAAAERAEDLGSS